MIKIIAGDSYIATTEDCKTFQVNGKTQGYIDFIFGFPKMTNRKAIFNDLTESVLPVMNILNAKGYCSEVKLVREGKYGFRWDIEITNATPSEAVRSDCTYFLHIDNKILDVMTKLP